MFLSRMNGGGGAETFALESWCKQDNTTNIHNLLLYHIEMFLIDHFRISGEFGVYVTETDIQSKINKL